GFGGFDDLGEGLRIADGDFAEALAVQVDAGLLQQVDELAVSQPIGASRGADAGDPELAEVALAQGAVKPGVTPCAFNGYAGLTVALAAPPVTLGELAELLVAPVARGTAYGMRHLNLLGLSDRVSIRSALVRAVVPIRWFRTAWVSGPAADD